MSLSPPPPTPRPGELGVVAGLVFVEPAAAASRTQVHGRRPAAAGAVPARTAGLPASLLGPGCPCHLAHQHHPCPCPLFPVSTPPCPGLTFLVPFLPCSVGKTEFSPASPRHHACTPPTPPPGGALRARRQCASSAHSFLEEDSLYLLKESKATGKLD